MYRLIGAAALFPQHTKSSKGCKRGKLIRKLMRETRDGFTTEQPTAEQMARAFFIDAGKQYCVARCGGCELTAGWTPPTPVIGAHPP